MNKRVDLRLSISEVSKAVMYECWYDYVKKKYRKKGKVMIHGCRQFCSPKRCLNKIVRLFANDNKIIKLIDKTIIKKIVRYCLVMVIK